MTQSTKRPSRLSLILISSGLSFVMAVAVIFAVNTFQNIRLSNIAFTIPREVRQLELVRDGGDPVRLADLQGRYTLLSFGYTHCPDVCPLTLTEYRRVKRDLSEGEVDQVQFAFVSVDGERDTPDLLDQYLERFDPAFIGITTADDAVMRQVADGFNVYYEKRQLEGTQASYLVDHTATMFLLAPSGHVAATYPFGTAPQDIAADISSRLS